MCFILLIESYTVSAGVIVEATRLIYPATKSSVSVNLKNPDNIAYLIQSWVENAGTAKAPFIITPPLFRLDSEQDNTVRVVFTGSALPTDKESLYWLNIKAIPSLKSNEQQNTLQLAITTRIKLIYRPASLEGSPQSVAKNLIWTRHGNALQVSNPTPFYMNFYQVKLGSYIINDAKYVPPMETLTFTLPDKVNTSHVSWKIINDYGGIGSENTQKL